MRCRPSVPRLSAPRLYGAALLVVLCVLAVLLFALNHSALAQTGSNNVTFVKEATPADGSNFVLSAPFTLLGSFGSADNDGGEVREGEFSAIEGIVVGPDGLITVVDSGYHRVQQFDAAGNFVRMWGKGVNGGTGYEICTSDCKAGSTGDDAGEFTNPRGAAVGLDGTIYIVDNVNKRVQLFTATGEFVSTWGKNVDPDGGTGFEICDEPPCKAGDEGGDAGEFSDPNSVAVGLDGSVYVTDGGSDRIQQFTAAGEFVRTWGKDVDPDGGTGFEICDESPCKAGDEGGDAGEFIDPWGISVAPDGSIYVGDVGNERVQQFTAAGEFVRTWGKDVDPDGGTGFEICEASPCKKGEQDSIEGAFFSPYYALAALRADGSTAVYVGDYSNERIQEFNADGQFVRTWGWGVDSGEEEFEICIANCESGIDGSGLGQFSGANGLAMGPNGTLYVTEYTNDRVARFLVGGILLDDTPIDDGDEYTDTVVLAGLPNGSHTFSESFPAAFWSLDSVTCTEGADVAHNGDTFTLTLSSSANVTCTLSNVSMQTLTVHKVVVGGGPLGADDFSLFIDNSQVTRGVANQLIPGDYSVSESNDPRYTASFSGDCDDNGDVTLNISQDLNCTITNTYITQTLTVEKVVVGGGPLEADDFPLSIDGTAVARGVANELEDGTHVVSETVDSRYAPAFSGDCDANGVVDLGIGEHLTCTITNTYITQTLTVDKVVVGGPLDADDFPLFIDGNPVTRGAANELDAGTYTVSETSDPEYEASFGGACDDAGHVTLDASQHVTCTITNTYVSQTPITQTLTVEKVVVGGGPLDADDFPLFIDGNPVARGAANELDAGTYTVSETSDPNYEATFGGACSAEGSVTLAIGEHLTCTITNTHVSQTPITQTLTVQKIVVGALEPDDFELFIDGNAVTRGAANLLAAGTYTVSESANAFYVATFSGDCDENGIVTLGAGEHLTCTITNVERAIFLPSISAKAE